MDYLQYTIDSETIERYTEFVLNLIINGLPSIPKKVQNVWQSLRTWVLNLIINGLPSIPPIVELETKFFRVVLNLIINGLPSIL